jgi:hypothetical protein
MYTHHRRIDRFKHLERLYFSRTLCTSQRVDPFIHHQIQCRPAVAIARRDRPRADATETMMMTMNVTVADAGLRR